MITLSISYNLIVSKSNFQNFKIFIECIRIVKITEVRYNYTYTFFL